MMDGCKRQACGWCCFGFWCAPCAACVVRRRALDMNLTNYRCCQGYFQRCCCCPAPGSCCEESCPSCCLCLESWFCHSCSMSSTRMLITDKYGLGSEPSDYHVMGANNTLVTVDLATNVVCHCIPSLSIIPGIFIGISALMYSVTMGCMTDQMINEMQCQAQNGNSGSNAPVAVTIAERNNNGPSYPPPAYGVMAQGTV